MSVVERSHEECPLTPAELRVLELLMEGLSYKEIAAELDRKTSTIRSQLTSAYHRLGVTASYQAVLECVRAGWLVWSDQDPETAVLMRVEGLMRELVEAVETAHEREELTETQREYLSHLDDYLSSSNGLDRHASRARMDQALSAMLREAHVTPAGRPEEGDLVSDLSSFISRTRAAA